MWLLSSVSLCVFVLFLFFPVFCVLSLIVTSAAQRNYSSSRAYSVTGTFKKTSRLRKCRVIAIIVIIIKDNLNIWQIK